MTHAYTTTTHHFERCETKSVHRRWPQRDEVAVLLERWESGGRRGDEVTFHLDPTGAKKLCRGLLNIIGNDSEFHRDLERLMRLQRDTRVADRGSW